MTIRLINLRNEFCAPMPAVIARSYSIIIDGATIELTKAEWDAIWARSYADRISMEAAYAAEQEDKMIN